MEHFTNPDLFSNLICFLNTIDIYYLSLVNVSFSVVCLKVLREIDKLKLAREWSANLLTYLIFKRDNFERHYSSIRIIPIGSFTTYVYVFCERKDHYGWATFDRLDKNIWSLLGINSDYKFSNCLPYEEFITTYSPVIKNIIEDKNSRYNIRLIDHNTDISRFFVATFNTFGIVNCEMFIDLLKQVNKIHNGKSHCIRRENYHKIKDITEEWLESLYKANKTMTGMFKKCYKLINRIAIEEEEEEEKEKEHFQKKQKI